jgi:hypothetical protein
MRGWTEHQLALAERKHAEGLNYTLIGAAVGKSRLAIAGWVHRRRRNDKTMRQAYATPYHPLLDNERLKRFLIDTPHAL